MNVVRIRNLEIGTGVPKICVPIVGRTREEIICTADKIKTQNIDLVEWRADWYDDIFDASSVKEVLACLRTELKEIPLLFTIRSKEEGGERNVCAEKYKELNLLAAQTGYVDLVDVELFKKEVDIAHLVNDLHRLGTKVIGSNHEFQKTPEKKEMIRRLCLMQEYGMDILKIAVMPCEKKDTLELLETTEEMVRVYARCPVVAMSMGGLGVISRICGEAFGSSITFGTVGKASAPGQLEVSELRSVLEILHQSR